MGMSAPKTVAPPDPVATAQAQGQMNKETAISQAGLNATNQVTPNGSLSYNQIGTWADGTPHYEATQTLAPAEQQLNDLGNQIQLNLGQAGANQISNIAGTFSQPADFSQGSLDYITGKMDQPANAAQYAVNPNAVSSRYTDPTAPQSYLSSTSAPASRYTDQFNTTIATDPTAPAARYTNAAQYATDASAPASRYTDASQYVTDPTAPTARYSSGQIASNDDLTAQLVNLGSQRLDPLLANQRASLDTALANKGLKAGSTGYDRSMTLQNQSDNDAYNQLILTGQNQAFNQAATRQSTAQSANAQNYGMDLSGKQYTQGVNAQNFGQTLSANNQNFNQDLSGKQYTLAANAQNYGQDLGSNAQNYGMDLSNANYTQGVNQQNYAQLLSNAQLNQGINAQNYAQDLSGLNYTLGANQQNYGQGVTNAQYTQGVNQQNYGQDLSNATYAQGAQAQNYANATTNYNALMGQRQQALSEIAAQRNQPLNEISAMLSGSQVTSPTFVNTPNTNVQPTDYTGLVSSIYQGQVSNANSINQANAAATSGLYSGIGSIFGGLASFGAPKLSDARSKENIEKLGEDPQSGHSIYAYNYKPETGMDGQRQIGLMAQDVEQRNPEAVITTPSGLKAIDYSRALSGIGGAFNRRSAA